MVLEKLTQFCTLEYPLNLSSHDPILTKVMLEDTAGDNKESKFAKTYSEFKPEKIIWEEGRIPDYQNLASQALSYASSNWDPT